MTDLEDLVKKIITFRDERNWDQYHSPKDLMLGLMCEVAELAEHFKYYQGEELQQRIEDHKEEISEELIDVLWWILLISHDLKIDIAKTFDRKIKKNSQKYPK